MKCVLLLLALLACERADKVPAPKPPPPVPKPDPIRQARDEFELVSPDLAAGTSKIYSRGDFMANATVRQQFDQGDFLGRMITLFGPRADHMWVLRHKQTGEILTAYAGDAGPAYGGVLHLDRAADARVKGDPLLAQPAGGAVGDASTWESMRIQALHLEDAQAGPQLAGVARRLDALVSQVAPADWDMTTYYAGEPSVYHVGAKGGVSFDDELVPEAALAFLLHTADATDPNDDQAELYKAELYKAALEYYITHKAELADQKPRMVTAYRRFVALANKAEPDERSSLLDEARALRP